jgi:hypothetical protein
MAMFDTQLFNCGFAFGSVTYIDRYPGDERNARVVVTVTIAGSHTTPMIVDTGTPWCILDPETAEVLDLVATSYSLGRRLSIRGTPYQGMLVRVPITIQPHSGDELALEATFFIPILEPGDVWRHPNFLGLDGFLNHIRFAVDAQENAFYFGRS